VAELRIENAELIEITEASAQKDSQLKKAQATVELLTRKLEECKLTTELEHLRVVNKLQEEHYEALKCEQAQVDFERERVRSLTETFAVEKATLKGEIESLLSQVNDLKVTTTSAIITVDMDTRSGPSDGPSDWPSGIKERCLWILLALRQMAWQPHGQFQPVQPVELVLVSQNLALQPLWCSLLELRQKP